MNQAYSMDVPVSEIGVDARATFVGRTYSHLFGAIMAFTFISILLYQMEIGEPLLRLMGGMWLVALGLFMVVGWVFRGVAHSAKTLPMQYVGLGGYVVAESIFFCPLLFFIADARFPGSATVIRDAAVATLIGFTALTLIAFMSRKDFSFLGCVLKWGGVCPGFPRRGQLDAYHRSSHSGSVPSPEAVSLDLAVPDLRESAQAEQVTQAGP